MRIMERLYERYKIGKDIDRKSADKLSDEIEQIEYSSAMNRAPRKYDKFLIKLQQQGKGEESANQVESEQVQSKVHQPPQRSGHCLSASTKCESESCYRS